METKSNKGRKKDIPKDIQRMNWDPLPGKPNNHRIAKLIKISDNKQEELLKDIIPTDKMPNNSKVYTLVNGKWELQGERCLDCGKLMSKSHIIEKHPSICTQGLLINKQEEQQILKLVKGYKDASTKSNEER